MPKSMSLRLLLLSATMLATLALALVISPLTLSAAVDSTTLECATHQPDQPTGLVARSTEDGILLTWDRPEADDTVYQYIIYRQVMRLNTKMKEYARLSAADANRERDPETTSTSYPTHMADEDGVVEVIWVHLADVESGCRLSDDESTPTWGTSDPNPSFLDEDVTSDTRYAYRVIARNMQGIGEEQVINESVKSYPATATFGRTSPSVVVDHTGSRAERKSETTSRSTQNPTTRSSPTTQNSNPQSDQPRISPKSIPTPTPGSDSGPTPRNSFPSGHNSPTQLSTVKPTTGCMAEETRTDAALCVVRARYPNATIDNDGTGICAWLWNFEGRSSSVCLRYSLN